MKKSNPSGIRSNPIGSSSVSRANNKNNPFPLLRLPLLAIEEILKGYTPYELFSLSTLSKRAKFFANIVIRRQHFNFVIKATWNTCLELRYKNNKSIVAVKAELAIMFGLFEYPLKECKMNLIGEAIPVKLDCMMDNTRPDQYDDEDDTDYIPEDVDSDEEEYVEIEEKQNDEEDEMETEESREERERARKYLVRCARDTIFPKLDNHPEVIKMMIKDMLDFFKNTEYVDFCITRSPKDLTLDYKRCVEVDLRKNVNKFYDSCNQYNLVELIELLSCERVRIKAVISNNETETFLRRWIRGGPNRLTKIEKMGEPTTIELLENSLGGRRTKRSPYSNNVFRVERDDGLLGEIAVLDQGTTVSLLTPIDYRSAVQ